jgi:hypothetical protein
VPEPVWPIAMQQKDKPAVTALQQRRRMLGLSASIVDTLRRSVLLAMSADDDTLRAVEEEQP